MKQGLASGNARLSAAASASGSLTLLSYLLTPLLVAAGLFVSPALSRADELPVDADAGLVALSDEQLETVTGGDYELALEGFEVLIAENEAGYFTMDIAQNAFDGAQGLFTTLQAVNSAVNLNVIVNIYVDRAAGSI
jgi:hypothetical protein